MKLVMEKLRRDTEEELKRGVDAVHERIAAEKATFDAPIVTPAPAAEPAEPYAIPPLSAPYPMTPNTTTINNALQSARGDIDRLQEQLMNLAYDLEAEKKVPRPNPTMQKDLEEARSKFVAAEATTKRLTGENQQLQKENTALKDAVARVEKTAAFSVAQIKIEMETKLSDVKKQLEDVRSAGATIRAENTELKNRFKDADEQASTAIMNLVETLEALQNAYESGDPMRITIIGKQCREKVAVVINPAIEQLDALLSKK